MMQNAIRSNPGRRSFLSVRNVVTWVTIALILFVSLFPFWWVVRTALTDPQQVYTNTTAMFPENPTLYNFSRALGNVDLQESLARGGSGQTLNFWLYLRNSVIVATVITIGQVFFSSLAAYAFARLRFPLRNQIFFLFLTGLMIPGIVLLIPNFILVRSLGWIGTFQGIIAPSFLMTPLTVFFMRQFFLSQSVEIEEAALLDGAGRFQIFLRIALPLSGPALATIAILTFVSSWNDYLWPLVVGRDDQVRMLTVALGLFRSQQQTSLPDWSGLMAAATLMIIPTLVLFLILGRRVVNSIQYSGFR
ncbi:carbohydrate ABC transporter permease [Kamptonema cortianum]|jgi:multiple sugar transport system permease protein|nr:carbohydrate ABC transporter permease [Oscillatoria laete-virens]MDI9636016.1 carbohydrate ABC transporter permease [Geitlerinema splendidum]MDK3157370.1 carbohydrate ABC transporter permease [Kamptonema cortianum]MDL5054875.1 carbohydrate ABC transporter permease [Oscillatoria laete-virens NRMC-F 0139]